MPNIKRTMFILAVPDLAKSAAWYRDVLGCEIHEIGDPGWRFYKLGDWRIMAGEAARLFKSHRPDYPDGGQKRDFIWVASAL